jgi:hypothetical protein
MLAQQFRDPQICWDAKDPSCIQTRGAMQISPALIGPLHVWKIDSLMYGSSTRGFLSKELLEASWQVCV